MFLKNTNRNSYNVLNKILYLTDDFIDTHSKKLIKT